MIYKTDSVKPYSTDTVDYQRIYWVSQQFSRFQDYWRPEIERMIRNQRMYWGINFGQWPSYVVEKLRSQGRRPPTLNIIGKKIESQVSQFISNSFDVKFSPVDGKINTLTEKLQDLYFSDKYNLDWDTAEIVALRDCFTMVGYERMFISDEMSDFGNISWEAVNPTHIYLDPAWRSVYSRDLERYFTWDYLLADEISRLYPRKSDRIKEIKEREEMSGIDYGEYHGGVQSFSSTEEKWGSSHKVIEYHYIKREERLWEYDLKNNIPFPETGYKAQSQQDRDAKIQYIAMMGLDPNSDIAQVSQTRRVKYVESICPTIDSTLMLSAGKDKIQTNNVNLYPLGSSMNGQFKGTVDDLYDIQVGFNKGEMDIDDIQRRSARGAFILDKALVGGDRNKMAQIEEGWNDPGARMWVDEGTTADLGQHGGIIELRPSQVPGDVFTQNNRRLDLADWLSMVPAAMDSRSESSTESGKLYQSKVQVGIIGQKYYSKLYERHKRDKAAAYVLQAKYTYASQPRMFSGVGGKPPVMINQPAQDAYGSKVILDDISSLPEMRVVLVPSSSGLSVRTERRTQYTEILQTLNDPRDRLLKLVTLGGIYETLDLQDDKKEELDKAVEMLTINAALEQALTNVTMKTQMMQAQLQGAQMMNQLNPPQQEQQGEQQAPQQISQRPMDKQEMEQGSPQEDINSPEPAPQGAPNQTQEAVV